MSRRAVSTGGLDVDARRPAPPRPVPDTLSGCIQSLLALFGDCQGHVFLDAWSEGGVGHEVVFLPPGSVGVVPAPVLNLLEANWEVKLGPATRSEDGTPISLAALVARWRPDPVFKKSWPPSWTPRLENLTRIAEALRTAPLAPTFVLDGGLEIAALWALESALDLHRDAGRAVAVQRQLAARLGADRAAAEDLRTLVPLPGSIVRGVGFPPPLASFAVVAPERTCSLDRLEEAFA